MIINISILNKTAIIPFFFVLHVKVFRNFFENVSCRKGLFGDTKGYLLLKYYLMSYEKTVNVFWSLTLNVMLSEVMTEVMVYSVLFSLNFRL